MSGHMLVFVIFGSIMVIALLTITKIAESHTEMMIEADKRRQNRQPVYDPRQDEEFQEMKKEFEDNQR